MGLRCQYIDGLMQEWRISNANTLRLGWVFFTSTHRYIPKNYTQCSRYGPLTRYVKLRVAHAPGMPGTFFPPPRVSDPAMHHGTCVTHVPWCMPRSLPSGFLWSRWQGKRSRHSRRMRNPQFYVSGKRPMVWLSVVWFRPMKPIFFRIISLALGLPRASEAALRSFLLPSFIFMHYPSFTYYFSAQITFLYWVLYTVILHRHSLNFSEG